MVRAEGLSRDRAHPTIPAPRVRRLHIPMAMTDPSPHPRITAAEPTGPRGSRVRLHLDEGDPLEILLETFETSGLGVGDPLAPDRRRRLLDDDADGRVREAAMRLLAARARTRTELFRRLKRKSFDSERIERCLGRLEQSGLLDDEAAAAAFVRDRLRHRPRGRARLTSELRAKGIQQETAEGAIARVFEDEEVEEETLALQVAERWVTRQGPELLHALASDGNTPERDAARRRLHGYLARRGFRGDALRSAMDRARSLARGHG